MGAARAVPRHTARVQRETDNLKGAALMAACALVFAAEALMARALTARGVPVEMQVFFRAIGQLVWVAPLLLRAGLRVFHTQRAALHILRGLSSVTTWGFYYLAFAYLDLATATVLSFTNVMFTTLLAGPVLGERVDAARWVGTIGGLLGVAIMLRPGADLSWVGAAIALTAAVTWCGITLTSRMLTSTESTETIVAWVGLVTTLTALPFAIHAWVPLGAIEFALLAILALFTPGIIWLLTEALRAGEASFVAPFQYLRLIVIAAFGWLLYGEIPDVFAIIGAVFILGGAVVITVAEARK